MKALVFDRFGDPAEVLQVRDVPTPEPGPGEVRVRMIASPVNPSDLLVVRGRYGVLPSLPATPGFEGVGVVDRVGPGVNILGRLVKGKRVCAINSAGGNWAEYAVIPARQARPVPSDLPDEQVASFFVNPATALALVRHVLKVRSGAWLAQSAAGSELGKMIVRLAKHDRFRTLNIVRRPESEAELRALGADRVICSPEPPSADDVRAALGADPLYYAVDPVGGATGGALVQALNDEGRLIVYGSLSEQPIPVPSRHLIARRCKIEGFWLGHFMRSRGVLSNLGLFREITDLIRANVLSSTIENRLPLARFADAIRLAESPGRRGKILLDCRA